MTSTVITHIYNEEFLLPNWLKYHKQKFENGIIIDYHSTDKSVKIVENLVPHWKIIKSTNLNFSAQAIDQEIKLIEKAVIGRRIVLTSTEFFIGNPDLPGCDITVVPSIELVCDIEEINYNPENFFHEQIYSGLSSNKVNPFRPNAKGRLFHSGFNFDGKKLLEYPTGRHFDVVGKSPFLIYRVQNCLVNEEMINRQLRIQFRIPREDIENKFGSQHHLNGEVLSREIILGRIRYLKSISEDLREVIAKAIFNERLLKWDVNF